MKLVQPVMSSVGGTYFHTCHLLVCSSIFRRVLKIAKSDYQLRHVCPSVCPHETNQFLQEGLSLNLAFEYFSKICRKYSGFIKI